MIINLSDLLDDETLSIHFERELELESINVNERDINFIDPISVIGDIYKVSKDIVIEGQIIYKYRENCARCLKDFEKEVKRNLSGTLVNRDEVDEEDTEVDDIAIEYGSKQINIKQAVLDEIILSLPMKSLCKSDCKGICQKCGQNLNKKECDCTIDNIDPRLEKLKELL